SECRGKGIAGNQVQRARSGWAEGGAVRVVAHGEVLRVVPEGGDGVAVVVAHGAELAEVGVGAADDGAVVHQAAVKRALLVGVVVIFVGGDGNAGRNAEGIDGVGVVVEQARSLKGVGARRVVLGMKRSFTGQIGRVGVGAEVVIE